MDDLICEFLIETNESLVDLDSDFVELEQNPKDMNIIGNIFRVMHTIKGTCGFLGLSRLEKVAHAGENILDKLRDQVFIATPDIISLILEANDRIKAIIEVLEETEAEPEGSDQELIDRLNSCADSGGSISGMPAVTPAAETAPQPTADAPLNIDVSTPDLDGEIDFTPVVADYANTETATAPAADAPLEIEVSTPDLDGEIDFTPVVADYANTETAAPVAAEKPATTLPEPIAKPVVSQEAQKDAVSTGLKVASDGATKKKPVAAQSIRVNLDILEDLMQMVGELVLTRNQLLQMTRNGADTDSDFNTPLQRLNLITSELQEGVLQTRMQPIGNAWAKFPRLVRDLSHDLNKKIELKMIGAETDLDRQMLEAIKDPLTHMVRNSADHGVETPDERVDAGKSPTGTITLSAYHEGGHIIVRVADDGKGLNLERIKEKAIENGIATPEEIEQMSERQIYQFIYKAGFSTAEAVTAVSGRGVGMDVVVSNIEKTGGHVEVNSWPGRGSEFLIKLPLTLAIMPVLIVQSGIETFAIPQIRVAEIVRIEDDIKEGAENNESIGYRVEKINDAPVLRLRGRLLPLVSLADTLGIARTKLHDNDNEDDVENEDEPEQRIEPFVVVCEVGSQSFGILVDKVFHTEEIVVKPNSKLIKDLDVYAGCTILGDGSVILILDPNGIIKASGVQGASTDTTDDDLEEKERASRISSFLAFNAWDKAPKAVPLELVSRLEEVDVKNIEWSGNSQVVQYRGGLMHLAAVTGELNLPEEGIVEVIVFTDGDRTLGLVVENIIDIIRQEMDIKSVASTAGNLGSIVINGATTDLLDISHYFSEAFGDWLSQKDASNEFSAEDSIPKLLLVDDSPFFRKFMTPVLMVANYDVTACESGAEALELLNDPDYNFDIIVTDIDMPEMNGIEFTAKCRDIPRFTDIPIIALSSHDESDLGGDINSLGFTKFVSKSDRNELVNIITQVMMERTANAANPKRSIA